MAKMQRSLFVLILMGQCSFCVSRLYEYHFVKESKTWDEAKNHCRKNYTNLATVFDMTDVKRLADHKNNQNGAWIGLRNQNRVIRKWHWSQPGVEFNDSETKWGTNEPNGRDKDRENCVIVKGNNWHDVRCKTQRYFICYDETQQNKSYFIETKKSWLEAQRYCRENHTDLISGLEQLNDPEFKNKSLVDQVGRWIGLFTDTWRWSDESRVSFRHWNPDQSVFEEGNNTCAMTMSNGKWKSDKCNETKPFYCYEDKVILIKENKTWEEALNYCREKHRNPVSITNHDEQRWVQERAKMANSPHVWMGLRYNCLLDSWFWVSDEVLNYKNWESPRGTDECNLSGAMETGGQHKWFKKNADEKFNFICSKC